jgi:hypothetical protein
MGAIDLMGWVTNVTLYSRAITMPNRMIVIITTTKPQIRTSISSGVNLFWFDSIGFHLLFKHWGNKIFGARLCELASRFLALRQVELVGVLTDVSILVLAPGSGDDGQTKQQ